MSRAGARRALGWLRDLPDFRDYTIEQADAPARLRQAGTRSSSIRTMLSEVGAMSAPFGEEPPAVDLRPWMSPIDDQGSIGSCTASAGTALIEYYERRAFSRHVSRSRLFLYKATRNLLRWTGDSGAFLRTTMGALSLFGVPPEEYWQYDVAHYDTEPTAFCYAFAQGFQNLQYFRLDSHGTTRDVLLSRIRTNLASGLPSTFGFTVYSSIAQATATGGIPFPGPGESIEGGHAVVAAGYDDNKIIRNANSGGITTRGALLVRNSWGAGWGQAGYGWLPYEYVLRGLAVDWWCLLKPEWIDTGQFGVAFTLQGMAEADCGVELA
jgi:C1A family cysteine protease